MMQQYSEMSKHLKNNNHNLNSSAPIQFENTSAQNEDITQKNQNEEILNKISTIFIANNSSKFFNFPSISVSFDKTKHYSIEKLKKAISQQLISSPTQNTYTFQSRNWQYYQDKFRRQFLKTMYLQNQVNNQLCFVCLRDIIYNFKQNQFQFLDSQINLRRKYKVENPLIDFKIKLSEFNNLLQQLFNNQRIKMNKQKIWSIELQKSLKTIILTLQTSADEIKLLRFFLELNFKISSQNSQNMTKEFKVWIQFYNYVILCHQFSSNHTYKFVNDLLKLLKIQNNDIQDKLTSFTTMKIKLFLKSISDQNIFKLIYPDNSKEYFQNLENQMKVIRQKIQEQIPHLG